MQTDDPQNTGRTVLHRMIAERDRLRAPHHQAVVAAQSSAGTSLEKAAATALARVAERLHHLPILVEKVRFSPTTPAELAELLPERALLAVVEAGRDQVGVVAICPGLLASVIEMQALGRLTSRKPVPRRATRTDAAISADLVNGFLAELGRELAHRPDSPAFQDFRYATFLDDPRPLGLMLEDSAMVLLGMSLRMGTGGQRDGQILVALPVTRQQRQDAAATTAALITSGQPSPPDASPPPPPAATLAPVVQEAPITLVGVLCRRMISLKLLKELEAGATIPLGGNTLNEARLETTLGQVVAHGRLGESEGYHALRLRGAGAARPDMGRGNAAEGPTLDASMADLERPDPFRVPQILPARVS
ncbi:MAG: FliM/FliN family flagellar motor C-terminal domain-containing protein [Paracoccus sp. (in: a-proteobacteria)]|uniref:FliM/FliN family flagellar motor C-terminal domain-containing protein n=1 Tax=Paracoccus sp. TaxID=267 RepID=UPI0039E2507F